MESLHNKENRKNVANYDDFFLIPTEQIIRHFYDKDIWEIAYDNIMTALTEFRQNKSENISNLIFRMTNLRECLKTAIKNSKTKLKENKRLFVKHAIKSLNPKIRCRLPSKNFTSFEQVFKEAEKVEKFLLKIRDIYEENDLKILNNTKRYFSDAIKDEPFQNSFPRNFDCHSIINDEDYNQLEYFNNLRF